MPGVKLLLFFKIYLQFLTIEKMKVMKTTRLLRGLGIGLKNFGRVRPPQSQTSSYAPDYSETYVTIYFKEKCSIGNIII